jgi:protein-S-isoprenylcysteine O-methyltransferase Ste14
LIFFATFLYAFGFVTNLGVPKSIDSTPSLPWPQALLIDLGLLSLFAIQHSVMARPFFKRWIERFIPAAIERSTYVLASSLALILLFWQWQPLGGVIWNVESPAARVALYAVGAFGWLLVLYTTFVINHFDLFGLRQVWRHLLAKPQQPIQFVTPFIYRLVRHPLYVGWFFAFWGSPTMTATHFAFASVTAAYILTAIQLEERDLMDAHPEYESYRREVPMLVPSLTGPAARHVEAQLHDSLEHTAFRR